MVVALLGEEREITVDVDKDESGGQSTEGGDATAAAASGATEERVRSLTAALGEANEQLRIINQFAGQVTGTLDLQRVLAITLEHVVALMDCERCAFLRHDAAADVFRIVALWQRRPDPRHVVGRVISSQTSVSGVVIRTGAPFVEDDIRRSTQPGLTGKDRLLAMGINSRVGIPISVADELWGTLIVEFTQIAGATPERVRFLTTLATHVAEAIQHAELFGALQLAHVQLQATQEEIIRQERLSSLGQMADGLARDLDQSISLVAGYGQLARDALNDPGFNRGLLDEILATVGDAARAGEQSVNRLLTFSRSQQVVPVEPVDLRAMLQEAVQLTAPRWHDAALAELRVIHVSVEVEGDIWVAGWPPGLLNAFVNLVQNAADALPRGGTVSLTAQRRGEEIVAEVTDDGTGIAPEVLPRIFEPFYSTKGGRGTGIGLTQVSRVVALHQGKVEVDTVLGQGTTVRLVLPAAVALVPAAAAPETDEAPLQPGALHILAVDDEEGIRLLMAAILEPLGHAVVVVGSGEAALAEMAAEHFDLVISDIGMGDGMNGWELAEQVRTRSPGTRFLLATGWGAAVDAAELDAKGVDGILTKPYNVREFQRQVALVTALS